MNKVVFTGLLTTGTPINLDPLLFFFPRKIKQTKQWRRERKEDRQKEKDV